MNSNNIISIDNKIKVLIVDDSALMRKIISKELTNDTSIEIIGTAPNPYIARNKIITLKPDVILLDIHMPRMDGLTFLKKLMRYYPSRVIIISSLANKGGEIDSKAIEYGALGVILKPNDITMIESICEELKQKIKEVSKIPIAHIKKNTTSSQIEYNQNKDTILRNSNKIIAIGASTGGTEAIKKVLENMPLSIPPIVIVQHMPKFIINSFASRLNELCEIEVKQAEHMEVLLPGKAVIAPGNIHMELKKYGGIYHVNLVDSPSVFHQKPSVDILFNSVAKYAGKDAIGVILTGMGKDGAQGLLNMKNSGAFTIAQDEKSSTVFGMPKESISLGAANKIISLDNIKYEIFKYLNT